MPLLAAAPACDANMARFSSPRCLAELSVIDDSRSHACVGMCVNG